MLVIGLKLGNRMLLIYSKENSPVEVILHQLIVDKTVFACSIPWPSIIQTNKRKGRVVEFPFGQ